MFITSGDSVTFTQEEELLKVWRYVVMLSLMTALPAQQMYVAFIVKFFVNGPTVLLHSNAVCFSVKINHTVREWTFVHLSASVLMAWSSPETTRLIRCLMAVMWMTKVYAG